jgi:hypothetical protein
VKINYWHLILVTATCLNLKGMGILTCHWAWCFLPVALPFLVTAFVLGATLFVLVGLAIFGFMLMVIGLVCEMFKL